MTSAMPRVNINLNKLRFPIHTFFFMKIREKNSIIYFSYFFGFFSYNFTLYTYFTYAATASTITDAKKLVMHRVFNTNCGTSFTYI